MTQKIEAGSQRRTRMAWAVSSETGKPIHISMLTKAQNGLECGCVCPSCRSTLQAVNVDKEAAHFLKANTRGLFFRHASGQQTRGCEVIAARLAALHLLFEHDLILLPAPMQRVTVFGASGTHYVGSASGHRLQVKIRKKIWIDDHTARLTTYDGRVIQIQLSSVREVSATEGIHGVIEIRSDDSEISTWTTAQILDRATLEGKTGCWLSHWDDQSLSDAAMRDAENQASDNSDLIPQELAHLVGLSASLVSESVLHWIVKEILADAKAIQTPGQVTEISSTYLTENRPIVETHRWPAQTLLLSQARLEQRIANMIPDVLCRANDSQGNSFDMFVEVVVTNPVSEEKLSKIRQLGNACLAVDLRKLRISGPVKREILRREVLDEITHKRWLYHPLIDESQNSAIARLNATVQKQDAHLQQVAKRKQDLVSMSNEHLLKNFIATLRLYWSGEDFEKEGWKLDELRNSLISRRILSFSDHSIHSKKGLLWHLEVIREKGSIRSYITQERQLDLFLIAMNSTELRPFITLLVYSINEFKPLISPEEREHLKVKFKYIRDSIDRGEDTYARPSKYDSLVATIYPELTQKISHSLGTENYFHALKREKTEILRKLKLEQDAHAAEQRQIQNDHARRIASRLAAEAYTKTFEVFTTYTWNLDRSTAHFSGSAQKHVQNFASGPRGKFAFDRFELVRSAWDARERNLPFSDWLALLNPRTAHNLQDCVDVLVRASLLP